MEDKARRASYFEQPSPRIGQASTGSVRRIDRLKLNSTLGPAFTWLADGRHLLVRTIPEELPTSPKAIDTPMGPRVQSNCGPVVASSTYENRVAFRSKQDMVLFDHFGRTQLRIISLDGAEQLNLGTPGMYRSALPSPDGRHVLVTRLHRPYSMVRALDRFPRTLEVWDLKGQTVDFIADLPLSEQVPIRGVPVGPRGVEWVPTEPATMTWVEALDGGDPRTKSPHRDRVMVKQLGQPALELYQTRDRCRTVEWVETGGTVLISEVDQGKNRIRTWVVDRSAAKPPRLIWDLSAEERYANPGWALQGSLPNGFQAIRAHNGSIYFVGDGASPISHPLPFPVVWLPGAFRFA